MPGYCDSLPYTETFDVFSSVIEERRVGYEDERYRRVEETYRYHDHHNTQEHPTAKSRSHRRTVHTTTPAWRSKGSDEVDVSINEKSEPPMTHTCHYNGDEPPSALTNQRRRSKERSNLRVTFKDPESGEKWTESPEYRERKSLNLFNEKPHGTFEASRRPTGFLSMLWDYVIQGNTR